MIEAKDRQVLKEFIEKYHTHQWLKGANLVDNHPTTMRKTLEINAHYKPVAEMMEILTFLQNKDLGIIWVIGDDK